MAVKQQQGNLKTSIRDTIKTIEEAVGNLFVDATADWKKAMEQVLKEGRADIYELVNINAENAGEAG